MPRTPRGGVRAGAPGQAYGQRTDLNAERSLPVRAVPGQTYGAAKAQLEAQHAVPMAAPPAPPPGGPPPGPPGPPPGGPPPGMPQQAPVPPGGFGPLARPTERPFEPVTTGIPSGPGAGPEVLPSAAQMTGSNLSAMLAQLARTSGTPELAALASHAAAQGQ